LFERAKRRFRFFPAPADELGLLTCCEAITAP
jgi:hypothetical protein